jgi:CheY-like chemotaxis protein
MDIQLAGAMDGIAAAHRIRTNSQHTVPIVFLTAFDADETLARAKLTEPFGYILKPFTERVLRMVGDADGERAVGLDAHPFMGGGVAQVFGQVPKIDLSPDL